MLALCFSSNHRYIKLVYFSFVSYQNLHKSVILNAYYTSIWTDLYQEESKKAQGHSLLPVWRDKAGVWNETSAGCVGLLWQNEPKRRYGVSFPDHQIQKLCGDTSHCVWSIITSLTLSVTHEGRCAGLRPIRFIGVWAYCSERASVSHVPCIQELTVKSRASR